MVPSGWSQKSFKELLRLDRGSSPRPIVKYITESEDGVNWIKIGDTKGVNSFITSTKQKITQEGAKKSRKVSKGEIILSNSMSYGKPFILNIDGYIHDGWFVIRKYEDNLDKDFLIQILGGEPVQRQYNRLAAGGVVTNISSELVYAVKINFPPIKEQQKIARILSAWDKAITTTEALIDNCKKQKKALMQQLLTGKKRFPEFEGEWDEIKLGGIGKCLTGLTYSPKDIVGADGMLVLRSSNIQDGKLTFEDNIYVDPSLKVKSKTQEGDILVCVRNGSRNLIGKTAIIKGKGPVLKKSNDVHVY